MVISKHEGEEMRIFWNNFLIWSFNLVRILFSEHHFVHYIVVGANI